jgi:hypothetical protein
MPRRSTLIPPELRPQLEEARLDTLALLRALDQALVPPANLPQPHTQQLFELDADCAEALWALDQPEGSLDFKAMVRDSLASLDKLSKAREKVRARLPAAAIPTVLSLERLIRSSLDPSEAYSDVPGRDPHSR